MLKVRRCRTYGEWGALREGELASWLEKGYRYVIFTIVTTVALCAFLDEGMNDSNSSLGQSRVSQIVGRQYEAVWYLEEADTAGAFELHLQFFTA
jgi:hypothetical protein